MAASSFAWSVPPYPYYPEGVVLAYLNPPPAGEPERGEQPVDSVSAVSVGGAERCPARDNQCHGSPDWHRNAGSSGLIVRELRAPASVSLAPDVRTPSGPPITTSVCAEIVSADGTQFKRLLFSLLYEPVQESGGTVVPERFAITAVTDVTDVVLNCA